MQGLPHPFSTTISGTRDEFSLEPSWPLTIASTSKPPASAALRRMSQCCEQDKSVQLFGLIIFMEVYVRRIYRIQYI